MAAAASPTPTARPKSVPPPRHARGAGSWCRNTTPQPGLARTYDTACHRPRGTRRDADPAGGGGELIATTVAPAALRDRCGEASGYGRSTTAAPVQHSPTASSAPRPRPRPRRPSRSRPDRERSRSSSRHVQAEPARRSTPSCARRKADPWHTTQRASRDGIVDGSTTQRQLRRRLVKTEACDDPRVDPAHECGRSRRSRNRGGTSRGRSSTLDTAHGVTDTADRGAGHDGSPLGTDGIEHR